jgi:N6-L-threonylcarbamoyladenine synthase
MKILAIETSCDETSLAIIEKVEDNKYKILSHETISQINLHREFGGVYPTLSRREHEKNLVPLLHKVLKDSQLLKEKTQKENLESFSDEVTTRDDNFIINKLGSEMELIERYPDLKENIFDFFSKYELDGKIDYIAVTNGPGLPPALWVGVNFSKVISILWNNIPIYPINHMEGHIIGGISKRLPPPLTPPQAGGEFIEIPEIKYPAICLLISGGHTELVVSRVSGEYEKIGETQDDAVGEAYDKVARLLGLPYPGGPEIGRLALEGRNAGVEALKFPRPMIHSKDLNFSFSGLKTHILYYIQRIQDNSTVQSETANLESVKGTGLESLYSLDAGSKVFIATEFEEAVKDVLIYKTNKAIEETGAQTLVVGGGVASNLYLKDNFEILAKKMSVDFNISSRELSTDNALMIALTCANQIENGVKPTGNFLAIGSKKYEWK